MHFHKEGLWLGDEKFNDHLAFVSFHYTRLSV